MNNKVNPSSNEVFRIYRLIPMEKVLPMMGARSVDDKVWELKNGNFISLEEDTLGQPRGWSDETANVVGQRGTIDLVQHVEQLSSFRDAFQWLKQKFPFALEQWSEPENSPANKANINRDEERDENGYTRADRRNYAISKKLEKLDIFMVLERMGAYADGRDGSKFRLPNGHKVIVSDNRWQDVYTGRKGFGGVQLYQETFECELDEAVAWMKAEFGEHIDESLFVKGEKKEKVFRPPPRFSDAEPAVRTYLINERGLPEQVVDRLMKTGTVYSTHPSYTNDKGQERFKTHEARCVFLGKASAELRDASNEPDAFKACCPGSETDHSGFSIKPNKNVPELLVTLVEAAIDGISYSVLFPGRFVMSTNGAGRFELMMRITLQALDSGLGVRLAQDADAPGDQSSQKVFNALYFSRLIHKKLGVDEDVVREWFVNGQVSCNVEMSPHHMFLMSDDLEAEYSVFEQEEGSFGKAPTMVDTGKRVAPEIVIEFHQNVHPDLSGKMVLPVLPGGYRYVKQRLNVLRERPVYGKDWNDELKRLGRTFISQYNELAKTDFLKGLPALPEHLERLRQPVLIQERKAGPQETIKVENAVAPEKQPVPVVKETIQQAPVRAEPVVKEVVEPEKVVEAETVSKPSVKKKQPGMFSLKR